MPASVPNNDTFSLEDVHDAVDGHANPTRDLADCFSDSESEFFDSSYDRVSYAPANSMLRFRNYEEVEEVDPPVPALSDASRGMSWTPSDCSVLSFPLYVFSLSASSLISYYLNNLGLSSSDVLNIRITGLSKDSGLTIKYNDNELSSGTYVNFSSGSISFGRLAAGSNDLHGTITFTIALVGHSGRSATCTYNVTMFGCP
jgi:hypothetical protein